MAALPSETGYVLVQTLGPAVEAPAVTEMETNTDPLKGAAASQAADESSNQRPVSGEKTFLLTVAQRAKQSAAAGNTSLESLCRSS